MKEFDFSSTVEKEDVSKAIFFYNNWKSGELHGFIWGSFLDIYPRGEEHEKAEIFYLDTEGSIELNGCEFFIEKLTRVMKYHNFI